MSADPWKTLGGRRRGLTAADRSLWRAWAAAAKVRPLPGRPLEEPEPKPPAATSSPVDAAGAAVAKPGSAEARPGRPPALPPIEVGRPNGGLDARRWNDLSRGRTRPERLLDLHGRRAQDAHAAVEAFLEAAIRDGLRCVAIVTGKGNGEGGVLRRELPHWLNAPGLRSAVLGAAHPHPSNPGAVHLLLRRAERRR